MATSCTALRAFSRHSSAMATIIGIVLMRGLGAGDRFVMPGDFVERAGELVTDEWGLDLMRTGSFFGSCLIFCFGIDVFTVMDSCTGDGLTVASSSVGLTVMDSRAGSGSGLG